MSCSKNSNEGLKAFPRSLLHLKAEESERIRFNRLANILADFRESSLPIQTAQVRHVQLSSTFTTCSSDIRPHGDHITCPSPKLICRRLIIRKGRQRTCERCTFYIYKTRCTNNCSRKVNQCCFCVLKWQALWVNLMLSFELNNHNTPQACWDMTVKTYV